MFAWTRLLILWVAIYTICFSISGAFLVRNYMVGYTFPIIIFMSVGNLFSDHLSVVKSVVEQILLYKQENKYLQKHPYCTFLSMD